MLRILGRPSSINVRKVLWTADEAGLAFTHESDWAGARDTRSPEFLALNPNGLVPVIVTNDGVLWESNAICRYLAGRAARKDLLPDQPFARAEVEKWMDWTATELNTAWRPAFLGLVRKMSGFDEAAIQRSAERWNALMLILEQRLVETGAFAAGGTFTVADVVLGLTVHRWVHTPIARPPMPALHSYYERLQARPAARAWLSPDFP